MVIKLLNEEIINQIAAGEVIENPAAVIKELVENSIDAKSSLIEVEIEDYGLKTIIVRDNGIGISKEDLLKAPLRHATSKISNFNDLYNIKTMGFRGEAIASIFSIANTKIISKVRSSDDAYEISSDDISKIKKSECSKGTQMIVNDLFYNTPARKKYLKSNNLELRSIIDVMNKFTIFHRNIKFILKHNGKSLMNKPIFDSLADNLYYIFGKELKGNLLEISGKIKGLKVGGFLGKPSSISYGVKKNQHIFVNSRFVKSRLINKAMYEGFGTNLMEARHPFFVIFIDIDPEIVDVNVHPTKIEIKFENELEIYEFICDSIKQVFEKNTSFKEFESKKKEIDISLDKSCGAEVSSSDFGREAACENKYYSVDVQKDFSELKEDVEVFDNSVLEGDVTSNLETFTVSDAEVDSEVQSARYGPLYDELKEYKIIGQINKTFIIIETPKEMVMIDQHVAEEKFFYESFKEQYEQTKPRTQKLLKSEVIEFSQSEMILYLENVEFIKKLGFDCEDFGEREIIVRGVPYSINGGTIDPRIILDIIYEIGVDNKFSSLEEKAKEKLASMACKKSIKAGKELTNFEIRNMIENLKKLKEPFNCPHGRPILLKWSFMDLEKKFKRIL